MRIRQALQRERVVVDKAIDTAAMDLDAAAAMALQASGQQFTQTRIHVTGEDLASALTIFADSMTVGRIPPAHRMFSVGVEIDAPLVAASAASPYTLDIVVTIGGKGTTLSFRAAEDPATTFPTPPAAGYRHVALFTGSTDYTDLYEGDDVVLTFTPDVNLDAAGPSALGDGGFTLVILSQAMIGGAPGLGADGTGGGGVTVSS